MGPTAAMGIATTFGVASTGTAISSLSGAAATNAALAWLGGGALAAGGGGMAAGEAFLALAGPIGWALAAASLVFSGAMIWKVLVEKKRLEELFDSISDRDINSYKLAIAEIKERIICIDKEAEVLFLAGEKISSFGFDYSLMSEEQQLLLGSYVNHMLAATELLTMPIMGLQPRYSENDCTEYYSAIKRDPNIARSADVYLLEKRIDVLTALANLLYKIDLDKKDRKLLCDTFRKNKDFLESLKLTKKDLPKGTIEVVCDALDYHYEQQQ